MILSKQSSKLELLKSHILQYRGLTNANYALYLLETKEIDDYNTIRRHIDYATTYFKRSLDIIDTFQETADFLDWVIIDQRGGIVIDFGSFEVECIDFFILKYNALQNAGSTLVSILSLIPSDINIDRLQHINRGIDLIRDALQITRDFDIMLQSDNHRHLKSKSVDFR